MRLINADTLKMKIGYVFKDDEKTLEIIRRTINEHPTIEAINMEFINSLLNEYSELADKYMKENNEAMEKWALEIHQGLCWLVEEYNEKLIKNDEKITKLEISSLLKSSGNAATRDIKTFTLWANNKISTNEMIIQFKANNYLNKSTEIDEEDMVEWLSGIGYTRDKNKRYV